MQLERKASAKPYSTGYAKLRSAIAIVPIAWNFLDVESVEMAEIEIFDIEGKAIDDLMFG